MSSFNHIRNLLARLFRGASFEDYSINLSANIVRLRNSYNLKLSQHTLEISSNTKEPLTISTWRIPQTDFTVSALRDSGTSLFCFNLQKQLICLQSGDLLFSLQVKTKPDNSVFVFKEGGWAKLTGNLKAQGAKLWVSSEEPANDPEFFILNKVEKRRGQHVLANFHLPGNLAKQIDDRWFSCVHLFEDNADDDIVCFFRFWRDCIFERSAQWEGNPIKPGYFNAFKEGHLDSIVRSEIQQNWNVLSQPLLANKFAGLLRQQPLEVMAFYLGALYHGFWWEDVLSAKIKQYLLKEYGQGYAEGWELLSLLQKLSGAFKQKDGFVIRHYNLPQNAPFCMFQNEDLRVVRRQSKKGVYASIRFPGIPEISINREADIYFDRDKGNVSIVCAKREKREEATFCRITSDERTFLIDTAWRDFRVTIGADSYKFLFKGKRFQITINNKGDLALSLEGSNVEEPGRHVFYLEKKKVDPCYTVNFFNTSGKQLSKEEIPAGRVVIDAGLWDSYDLLHRFGNLRRKESRKSAAVDCINPQTINLEEGIYSLNMRRENPFDFEVRRSRGMLQWLLKTAPGEAGLKTGVVHGKDENDPARLQALFFDALSIWFELIPAQSMKIAGGSFYIYVDNKADEKDTLSFEMELNKKKVLVVPRSQLKAFLDSITKCSLITFVDG